MITRWMARAEVIARAAQRRRLQEIAGRIRGAGIAIEQVGAGSLICRGKKLLQRWLDDPGLRFATRIRQ